MSSSLKDRKRGRTMMCYQDLPPYVFKKTLEEQKRIESNLKELANINYTPEEIEEIRENIEETEEEYEWNKYSIAENYICAHNLLTNAIQKIRNAELQHKISRHITLLSDLKVLDQLQIQKRMYDYNRKHYEIIEQLLISPYLSVVQTLIDTAKKIME